MPPSQRNSWIFLGERRDRYTNVILTGEIDKRLTQDARGTHYRIEGFALDGRRMQVICRFKENGSLIIITVYALTENL